MSNSLDLDQDLQSVSGLKQFAKVINRGQKSLITRKDLNGQLKVNQKLLQNPEFRIIS